MRWASHLAIVLITLLPGRSSGATQESLREFRLVERFGAAHRDQIIAFVLGAERIDLVACRMLDDTGQKVAFQVGGEGAREARPDRRSA